MIQKPKRKAHESNGNLKRIPIFYVHDHDGQREIILQHVIVNMDKFVCATPAIHAWGYGKELIIRRCPHTVEYPKQIDSCDWVDVHFQNSIFYNMFRKDFKEHFGMEPPDIIETLS